MELTNHQGQDEMKTSIDDYSFCHEASTSNSEGSRTPNKNQPSNDAGIPSMIRESTDKEALESNKRLKFSVDMASKIHGNTENGSTTQHIVDLVRANERLSSANERLNLVNEGLASANERLTGTVERLCAKNECLSEQVMAGREENLRLRHECDVLKANLASKNTHEETTVAGGSQIELISKGIRDSSSRSLVAFQENIWAKNKDELQMSVIKLKEENAEMKSSIAALEHNMKPNLGNLLTTSKGESLTEIQESIGAEIKKGLERVVVKWTEENAKMKSSIGNHVEKLLVPLKEDVMTLQQQVKRNPTPDLPKPRVCWNNSKSHIATWQGIDVLDCEPLIFGKKYKWSVKVLSIGEDYVELGVASTIHKLDLNEWLGDQKGGWSYDSDGEALHADEVIQLKIPEYKDGSKLTFVLDLTGNGTLSVYHDDDASNIIALFENMKSEMMEAPYTRFVLDDIPVAGFVPAVSFDVEEGPGKIEFLGFEDI